MSKLLSILFVAISLSLFQPTFADESNFLFPQAKDYPTLSKDAVHAADFVPKGWKILAKASGDLNGDKLADAALVVQGNIAKYKQKNSGLGGDVFDTNPRLLLILLGNLGGKGFRLVKSTTNIVGCSDSPTMDEPFESITIKKGVLEIHVQSFLNAGGWSASNTVYKFQLRDGKFVLIGAERDELQRNSGEDTAYSYNFLTGKLRVADGNIQSNSKKQITWKNLLKQPLRDIDQFKTLYEWQVIPDCLL